jgi:hypothetical protein
LVKGTVTRSFLLVEGIACRSLLGEAALSAFISFQLRFDWRVAKLNPPGGVDIACSNRFGTIEKVEETARVVSARFQK